MRCEATTKKGTRCHNKALVGSRFCKVHASDSLSDMAESEEQELEDTRSARDIFQDTLDELRKPSRSEFYEILSQHKLWKQSEGKEGKQADLSHADLYMIDFERLWLPDAILRDANFLTSGLKNSFFSGSDLRGANLNDTDLRDATLSDSDLRGAYLRNAKLSGASLTDTNLEGADLRNANFESEKKSEQDLDREYRELEDMFGADDDMDSTYEPELIRHAADVEGCNFRHANLSDASLSEVRGLNPDQLAGANLVNAKLPGDIAKFEFLDYIAELSKAAKNTYLAMISACFYSWLMILKPIDFASEAASSSISLPIINTEVSVRVFFMAAPLVLTVIFLYLQTYLQRLWAGLSNLPARFQDGRALDEKAYPWLFTSLVRLYFPRLKQNRPSLIWLQIGMTIFSAWIIAPATAIGFFIRYLPSHDTFGLSIIAITVIIALISAIITYLIAQSTLKGEVSGFVKTLSDQLKTWFGAAIKFLLS